MNRARLVLTLLATGVIFGLPHLLIPRLLGPSRPYTPFAVSGVSSVTYDETATYAALANYTALRRTVPYDTDLWETRNAPVPVTTAPFFFLAALVTLTGGLDNAFILCDFVLPPLAVLLLYVLLVQIAGSRRMALVGSLATILVAFGPRNFLGVPLLLLSDQRSSIIQPLEFSRDLHPELSFTLFLAAVLLLWRTVERGGRVAAVLGGLVGGLLFYTYVYYFPIWLGACALLLLGRRWLSPRAWSALWLTNVCTWIVSIPFWLSVLGEHATPNFSIRLARHYSEVGHVPPPEKLIYTAAYVVIFTTIAITYVKFVAPPRAAVLLFHTAIFAAAIAALNVEVILGFNLEAMNHFPNRFFQPFLMISGFVLLGGPAARFLARHSAASRQAARSVAYAAAASLLLIAVTRQTIVSVNVADKHELRAEHRLLFEWLNTQTNLDDVVLASEKDVNDLIPVFTHNLVFVPNGERTSASDTEIERRFLTAMRLLQRPEADVHELLAQDYSQGDQPLGLTYTYFLFVSGNGSYNLRLPEVTLTPMLADYRQLDLARELERSRLDYVYARGAESPAPVPGWDFARVYGNDYGTVWQVSRAGTEARDEVGVSP